MDDIILFCFLLGVVSAAPQGYKLPAPNNPLQPGNNNAGLTDISGGDSLQGSISGGFGGTDINNNFSGGFGSSDQQGYNLPALSNPTQPAVENAGFTELSEGDSLQGSHSGGFGGTDINNDFSGGFGSSDQQDYNLPALGNPTQPAVDNADFTDINGGESFGGSFSGGFGDISNSGGFDGGSGGSEISGGFGGGFGDSDNSGGFNGGSDGSGISGGFGGGFSANDNSGGFGGGSGVSDISNGFGGFAGGSGDSDINGRFGGSVFDSAISGGFNGGVGGSFGGYNDNNANGDKFSIMEGGNIGNDIGGSFGNGNSGVGFDVNGRGSDINSDTGGSVDVSSVFNGGSKGSIGNNDGPCSNGQVRHVDGSCVTPMVSRNIFVFAAPKQQRSPRGPVPKLPVPKVEYNLVFVRAPAGIAAAKPIVVPPPQQKTLVYVLSKTREISGQRVIEVPAGPPQQPEVYYINYDENENPTLPGGVDLQTALNAAGQTGQSLNDRSSTVEGGQQGGSVGSFGGGDLGGALVNRNDNNFVGIIDIEAEGDFGGSSQTNAGIYFSDSTNNFGGSSVNTPSQLYEAI